MSRQEELLTKGQWIPRWLSGKETAPVQDTWVWSLNPACWEAAKFPGPDYWAHSLEPRNLNTEPMSCNYWSLWAREPMPCKRSRLQGKPGWHRELPWLTATREKPSQQWRASTVKNKSIKLFLTSSENTYFRYFVVRISKTDNQHLIKDQRIELIPIRF